MLQLEGFHEKVLLNEMGMKLLGPTKMWSFSAMGAVGRAPVCISCAAVYVCDINKGGLKFPGETAFSKIVGLLIPRCFVQNSPGFTHSLNSRQGFKGFGA